MSTIYIYIIIIKNISIIDWWLIIRHRNSKETKDF